MSHLLSKQELADKLQVPLEIIDKYIKQGLRAVPGTDQYNWYQVKKWMKIQGLMG